MNTKAISFCLYGDRLMYYLGLLQNIKNIESKYSGYDVVVHVNEHSYEKFMDICKWEDYKVPDFVIFKFHEEQSSGKNGDHAAIMWRFLTVGKSSYDLVISWDTDQIIHHKQFEYFENFNKDTSKSILMIWDGIYHQGFMGGGAAFYKISNKLKSEIYNLAERMIKNSELWYAQDEAELKKLVCDKYASEVAYYVVEGNVHTNTIKDWITIKKEDTYINFFSYPNFNFKYPFERKCYNYRGNYKRINPRYGKDAEYKPNSIGKGE